MLGFKLTNFYRMLLCRISIVLSAGLVLRNEARYVCSNQEWLKKCSHISATIYGFGFWKKFTKKTIRTAKNIKKNEEDNVSLKRTIASWISYLFEGWVNLVGLLYIQSASLGCYISIIRRDIKESLKSSRHSMNLYFLHH